MSRSRPRSTQGDGPVLSDPIPPHDLALERAVLGAAVLTPTVLGILSERLTAESFYKDHHRALFTRLLALHTEGRGIDLALVTTALREAGELDAIGGMAALAGLFEEAASTALVPDYIEQIAEAARKRELLALAKDVQTAATNATGSAEIMARVMARVARAERLGQPVAPVAVSGDLEALVFTWRALGVEIHVTNLRDHSEGPTAEVDVRYRGETLHLAKLALLSTSTRATLAKAVAGQVAGLDWRAMLETVCRRSVAQLREGAPTVRLTGTPLTGPRYLVEPFVWHADLSVVFADGGSLKGFVGLVVALVAMTGRAIAGLHSRAGVDDRLGRLGRGLGLDVSDLPLFYRPMTRPLVQDLAAVREQIRAQQIGLLLLDSWQPACGTSRDGLDTALATIAAVRSLGPPVLAEAHMSKADAGLPGAARVYGSIFSSNLARCVWEIKRDTPEALPGGPEGGLVEVLVGAMHRKLNGGRLRPPFALEFVFDGDTGPVSVSRGDLRAGGPAVLAKLSVPQQILHVVQGGAKTTAEIAEGVGKPADKIRPRCNELAAKGRLVRIGDAARGGKGDETLWGLPSREEAHA